MSFTVKHTINPIRVGKIKETAVQKWLCVSFFIVKRVVEHGQCIRENRIKQTAVVYVQPLQTPLALAVQLFR